MVRVSSKEKKRNDKREITRNCKIQTNKHQQQVFRLSFWSNRLGLPKLRLTGITHL